MNQGLLPIPEGRAPDPLPPDHRLVARVWKRWQGLMAGACRNSSVPADFLGALVANESGGDPGAVRFEPVVYRHLKELAEGHRPAYGAVTRRALESKMAEMLSPGPQLHPLAGSGVCEPAALASSLDATLRELASSWGLTQIMGYHLTGRKGTPRDLLDPGFNLGVALQLLSRFVDRYQLDPRREFAEMFRCWNTGRPDGQTYDPAYVANGLSRMEIYREMDAAGH